MVKKYKIPADIYTAILMQESSYKVDAKGCHSGIESKSFPLYENENRVCSDFGIGQIYYKTAKAFGFTLFDLITDLDYSVEAGAIVLADFKKRYSHREVDWWTRYNTSSKSKRIIYKNLVSRYL